MVEYKIVKYCRSCKIRFVVGKRESSRYYCDKCEKIINKYREEE